MGANNGHIFGAVVTVYIDNNNIVVLLTYEFGGIPGEFRTEIPRKMLGIPGDSGRIPNISMFGKIRKIIFFKRKNEFIFFPDFFWIFSDKFSQNSAEIGRNSPGILFFFRFFI